mgnify:CR=1 FL=1
MESEEWARSVDDERVVGESLGEFSDGSLPSGRLLGESKNRRIDRVGEALPNEGQELVAQPVAGKVVGVIAGIEAKILSQG